MIDFEEKEKRQSLSMKKRWGILIAMAVVFGLIAGGIMYGINYAGGRIYREQHISSTDTVETRTASGDSSTAVEEITKNAMPSVVTISTMSVEEMQRRLHNGSRTVKELEEKLTEQVYCYDGKSNCIRLAKGEGNVFQCDE